MSLPVAGLGQGCRGLEVVTVKLADRARPSEAEVAAIRERLRALLAEPAAVPAGATTTEHSGAALSPELAAVESPPDGFHTGREPGESGGDGRPDRPGPELLPDHDSPWRTGQDTGRAPAGADRVSPEREESGLAPGSVGGGLRDAGPPGSRSVPGRRALTPAVTRTAEDPRSAGPRAPHTSPTTADGEPGGPAEGWARWRLTRRHGVLAGVGAAVLVIATVVYLLSARPVPTPVPVEPASPPASLAPSTPSAQPSLLVHVLGAVQRPGVVTLPAGSRVADAIQAAGGLAAEADPAELNLAAAVSDGSQILIGTRSRPRGEVRTLPGDPPPAAAGSSPAAASKVNLNTATAEQLDALPGVGPVLAQAILRHRQQRGRFGSVAELQEVDGVGPKTYAQLVKHVTV